MQSEIFREHAENCAALAEAASNEATFLRYKRMQVGWLALAHEQDWLDGKIGPLEMHAIPQVSPGCAAPRLSMASHERAARAASSAMEGKVNIQGCDLFDPTPELPDDTPIDRVQFPIRIHKALVAGGLRTLGEIRETSNDVLLNLQDLGTGSVFYLREALGLPSCDGVRPLEKKTR